MRKTLAKLGTNWRGIMTKEEGNDPRNENSYHYRQTYRRIGGGGGEHEILSIF